MPYIQSTVSTDAVEAIASQQVAEHHWFQLYVLKDRTVTEDLLQRAKKRDAAPLVISVDAVHFGNRERDQRHYRQPMKLSWQSYLHAATKPSWVWRVIRPQGIPGFGNLVPYLPENIKVALGARCILASRWRSIWIGQQWLGFGPCGRALFLSKGILCPADAQQAINAGFQGVILSNHGGRQLDGTVSPMTMLLRSASGVRTGCYGTD
ncbi:alpha-hydroxy acid oxidase [Vibrio sp. PP-XX7]